MSPLAIGFKTHSGWAALVAIDEALGVIERRRVELVAPENSPWAKQPYHAAEELETMAARQLVARGIEAAKLMCVQQMRAISERLRQDGHVIRGCGIVGNENMPDWTVEQILAVHMRMHKAEGVLFPAALKQAAMGQGSEVGGAGCVKRVAQLTPAADR
jgi:hypothetical protein